MTTTDREHLPARRAVAAVLGEVWAITVAGLDKIIEIAERRNSITPEVLDLIEQRQEAVAARKATRMDGTDGVVKRSGVAIIAVTGPILRYADLFSNISGATAIETLATDFNAAMDDPNVRGVILTFDSPGGQTNGVNEFSNMVRAARGRKPIAGYVGATAQSAAYWIASAVDPGNLVIDATATVGSIGAVVFARKGKDPNAVEIISSQSPKKRLPPESEAGMAEMQKWADALAAQFITAVKTNRGESVNTLAGASVLGDEAIAAGLADRLGSLEQLITEISNGTINSGGNMATTPNIETLLAENETTKKALAQAQEQIKKITEETQKRLVAAAESEAKAFIASLSGSKDLRFGKEELDEFGALFTEAKKASVSAVPELSAFASAQIALLEKFATKKTAVAPAGELKAGKVPEPKVEALTLEEFNEGGAKLAAAMDKYVAEKGLTGSDSYVKALEALGKMVGATVRSANGAGGSLSVDGDEGDE